MHALEYTATKEGTWREALHPMIAHCPANMRAARTAQDTRYPIADDCNRDTAGCMHACMHACAVVYPCPVLLQTKNAAPNEKTSPCIALGSTPGPSSRPPATPNPISLLPAACIAPHQHGAIAQSGATHADACTTTNVRLRPHRSEQRTRLEAKHKPPGAVVTVVCPYNHC